MISEKASQLLAICQAKNSHTVHLTSPILLASVDVSLTNVTDSLSLVTNQWRTHKKVEAKTANDVDYHRLNKLASKNRVTTAKDSYQLRQFARKTIALPDVSSKTKSHIRMTSQPLRLADDPYRFGMPNKPSTPMRTVICGTYGNAAEFDQLNRNAQIKRDLIFEKSKPGPRAPTRAMTAAHQAIA